MCFAWEDRDEKLRRGLVEYYRRVNGMEEKESCDYSELQTKVYGLAFKAKKSKVSSSIDSELIKNSRVEEMGENFKMEPPEQSPEDKLGLIEILLEKLQNFFSNSWEENLFMLSFLVKLMAIPIYINSKESFILHNAFVEPREDYGQVKESVLKVLAELANNAEPTEPLSASINEYESLAKDVMSKSVATESPNDVTK
eukprot:TRINITY_DN9361_c0_g7_i1.p1 TRINITY_DN9361_c0_g7~~TRINITY_DN9361_c0_g7_i1.p1  ORF type:complete len:198 (-),score=52.94 TRINITY_DN9361_c0_g7_i1:31-624(-)